MDAINGLLYGLTVAIQPANLLACLLGVAAGTLIGVLPGLGPTAGAAVLLPITFSISPTAGLIMIAGIYYGVMYGGSTTAILLNVPGDAPSVVSTIEGNQLARQGRAGPALFIITVGSFVAATMSLVLVTAATPVLANVGVLFGPAEFFALIFGGLLFLSRVMGGSFAAGLVPMVGGLLLATVGQDATSGASRFTFGQLDLVSGFGIVAVAIGLFGLTEMVLLGANKSGLHKTLHRVRVRDMVPTREDFRRSIGPWLRGGAVGFGFGLLPGPSATMGTFASYRLEKALGKDKSRFGRGAMEGLAGPEAANNAAATSSVIPILALGIPFSATLALMLAALIAHGVTPGPLLATEHPEVFWGVIGSMYIGNVVLVLLNIPLIGIWVSFLRIPNHLLIPIVIAVALAGVYASRNSYVDVLAALGFGALGVLFRWIGYQLAPLLVGYVLGPMLETNFREAMYLSRGDVTYFFDQPIAAAIWIVTVGGLIAAAAVPRWKSRRTRLGTVR